MSEEEEKEEEEEYKNASIIYNYARTGNGEDVETLKF